MGDIQHALKILFVFGQFQNGNNGRQMLTQFRMSNVVGQKLVQPCLLLLPGRCLLQFGQNFGGKTSIYSVVGYMTEKLRELVVFQRRIFHTVQTANLFLVIGRKSLYPRLQLFSYEGFKDFRQRVFFALFLIACRFVHKGNNADLCERVK